jgi:hypothetical protein
LFGQVQRDLVVTLYVGSLLGPAAHFREADNGATMMPMDLDLNKFKRHAILFRRPLFEKICAAAIPPAA